MKKKVFLLVGSLGAGGAERVFWLLSQGFNKSLYEVTMVVVNSSEACFSTKLEGVNVVELNTERASRSFFKLFALLKKERPYAVFSTSGQLNILMAIISSFIKIPYIIARETNIPHQMAKYGGWKSKFWCTFIPFFYKRFNSIVCQSEEMKNSILDVYNINPSKLIVIPNPILNSDSLNSFPQQELKKIIIVARLSPEKGHARLLDIIKKLPENYTLTIAGDGPLRNDITEQISRLHLSTRVNLLGQVDNIPQLIASHDVLALSSFTEGFPNVVLESLSVGTPVVTFRVGGITGLINDGINGYVVEQGDLDDFEQKLQNACSRAWDSKAIKEAVYSRFALPKVAARYESLMA